MCGIAAIVGREPVSSAEGWRMLETIRHRGPDGMGVATFRPGEVAVEQFAGAPAAGDVVLAHARLAIIDLSSAGFQPMSDADERVWVTFNGEIFNFQELRAELQSLGHTFASRTDTEVLVHGWKQWEYGLLERIEGMFAFALHDRADGRTVLVRDRLGIKPLYYAERADGALVAASEVKALLACGIEARLDPAGLDAYLRWRFTPDPQTTFLGIRKLEPGTALEIRDGRTSVRRYWRFGFAGGPPPTAEELRGAVDAAVQRQLVADVPLGAFFSGGIDSTAIVELMRRHTAPQPPTCFTVGFSDRDLAYDVVGDDLRYARLYGQSAGVDYREAILQPDLADSLPRVVWHMDEPIADPAALSAYHIAREASRELTVLMSGMGGDELFGGYPRYVATALAHRLRHVPAPVGRGAARMAALLPGSGAGAIPRLGRNVQKFVSGVAPFPQGYLSYLTYFGDSDLRRLYTPDLAAEVAASAPASMHREHLEAAQGEHWLDQAMHLDLMTFLPALNLTYMDKMAMAHSIEARVPLIDELVVAAMQRSTPEQRLHGRRTKVLFKEAMAGVVPEAIVTRPKAGFSAPARGWLRNELRPMMHELLSPARVRERGLFEPAEVGALIDSFERGRRDTALQLWQLLTLELWHDAFLDGAAAPSPAPAAAAT